MIGPRVGFAFAATTSHIAFAVLIGRAAILDPHNNDVWVNLARSFRGARQFEQAYAMFDRALNVAPQQEAILAEKGEAFSAAGDLQSAENLLAPLPRTLANRHRRRVG